MWHLSLQIQATSVAEAEAAGGCGAEPTRALLQSFWSHMREPARRADGDFATPAVISSVHSAAHQL